MFVGYNYYLFEGCLLDEEKIKELKINQAYKFQILSILDNYKKVLKVTKKGIVIAEIPSIKEELMNDSKNDTVFYAKKDEYLIFPDIDIYYGISNGNQVIALYKDQTMRDAKLSYANMIGFNAIFDDVKENQDVATSINQQLEIQKSYQKLKHNCKYSLD